MKVLSNHQGDVDWFTARAGMVTGSMVSTVLYTLKKGGESKERYRYKVKLVTEALYGEPVMGEGYMSPAMAFGVDNEPLAAAAYEMRFGVDLDENGFIGHEQIQRFGGSPDRWLGSDGLIEIKVPEKTTHIAWMDQDVVPAEHQDQMMAYMSITGRQWCEFVSFDPRAPERFQLFSKRLLRDEERIAEIEAGVLQFLAEVDEMVAKLQGKNPLKEQLRRSVEMEDGLGITQEDIDYVTKQQMEALGR